MTGTMRAYRIPAQGADPVWAEVPVPEPAPDEVLIQMTAAGLCRSDIEIMDHHVDFLPYRAPYTLGHENVGWVAALGEQVTDLAVGDALVVHAASSCGTCSFCIAGRDNFCLVRPKSYGIREDGGLAPYLAARRKDVLPIGDLDHTVAAPLGDAGATAYGVVDEARPYIRDEGFVVVIGVGGVGSLAVQLLRLLTSATVIAVDMAGRLDIARRSGAHECVAADGDDPVAAVRAITGPEGADAVLELVGTDETLGLASRVVRMLGAIAIVGTAGGTLPYSFLGVPFGVRVFSSTTCSMRQLRALYGLAGRGLLQVEPVVYRFADLEQGYADLRKGTVHGRPVVTFEDNRPGA